jgi:WD40 repeat protein
VAHQGHVFAVAFSPRGDSLATAGRDGLVRLWNLQGKPRGEPLAVHRGSVRSLAFSADGSFLASGGVDGEMRVWDRSSGELKSIQVGVPIEQIGVCPSFLWVRARSNVIRFYDLGFRLTATMILSPQESLVFTTDGWYGGHAFAAQDIALFDGSRRLDEGAAAERRSPRRVVAAILGEH